MSRFGGANEGRYFRPSMFGGFSFFPPVIKSLLITNVVAWVLFGLLLPLFTYRGEPIFAIFFDSLALWPLGHNFWPWQLVTYLFLHGGFWHLFFNMLALWMFGMELEHVWGSRTFLTYYLTCGIGAGIANLLVAPLLGQTAPTIGASGAVFGVLIAFGMLFPDRPIYIWFLLPIRAKFFVMFYIGLELFYGITGTSDGVAHIAHLGGALVGYIFVLVMTGRLPGSTILRSLESIRFPSTGRKSTRVEGEDIREAQFYDISTGKPMDTDTRATQQVIDDILDKINKDGYQSLTEEEKQILAEASKKIH
jgi:membrane associated rhomboid family serine protease